MNDHFIPLIAFVLNVPIFSSTEIIPILTLPSLKNLKSFTLD